MPNELVTLVERFVADAVANATADLRAELDREHERAERACDALDAVTQWLSKVPDIELSSPVPEAVSPPTPAPAPDPPLSNAQILAAQHDADLMWVEGIETCVNEQPVPVILDRLDSQAEIRGGERLAALEVALFTEQHGRNRKTLVDKLQERIAALSESSRVERLTALGEVLTGGADAG